MGFQKMALPMSVEIQESCKTFPGECLAGMQSQVAMRPEVVDDLFRDIHILALIPASFLIFFHLESAKRGQNAETMFHFCSPPIFPFSPVGFFKLGRNSMSFVQRYSVHKSKHYFLIILLRTWAFESWPTLSRSFLTFPEQYVKLYIFLKISQSNPAPLYIRIVGRRLIAINLYKKRKKK